MEADFTGYTPVKKKPNKTLRFVLMEHWCHSQLLEVQENPSGKRSKFMLGQNVECHSLWRISGTWVSLYDAINTQVSRESFKVPSVILFLSLINLQNICFQLRERQTYMDILHVWKTQQKAGSTLLFWSPPTHWQTPWLILFLDCWESVAMNIGAAFGYIPRCGIAGSYGSSNFWLKKNMREFYSALK